MFLSMKQASRQASRQAFKPRRCAFKDEASLKAGFKAGLEAGLEAGFQGLKDIFSMKQALRSYQMQATKTNPCRQKSREPVAPNERQKAFRSGVANRSERDNMNHVFVLEMFQQFSNTQTYLNKQTMS